MSFIVKGIDMPKDYVLRIEIEPNGTVWEEGRDWIKHRQSAIQIDRPHGRLIDADLFKELIKDSVPSWTIGVKIPTYGDMDIMGKIGCIPTILEAEE